MSNERATRAMIHADMRLALDLEQLLVQRIDLLAYFSVASLEALKKQATTLIKERNEMARESGVQTAQKLEDAYAADCACWPAEGPLQPS